MEQQDAHLSVVSASLMTPRSLPCCDGPLGRLSALCIASFSNPQNDIYDHQNYGERPGDPRRVPRNETDEDQRDATAYPVQALHRTNILGSPQAARTAEHRDATPEAGQAFYGGVEEADGQMAAHDATRRAFDGYYDRLFRLAVLLAQDPYEAEDIVQDAFVRSSSRLNSLPESEVFPYLRAAVVNGWRSRMRRLRVRGRHIALLVTPDHKGVDLDAAHDLWKLVLSLPPRQRATVVLRYYEDLSEQATAEVLDCSVGTVKSQLSRAIEHLRRRYQDEDRG
jgi:RNA polymerase sigma factor (sigma-70 family)